MMGNFAGKITLAAVTILLYAFAISCGSGGGENGDVIPWVVVWVSTENLGETTGTDGDIFTARSTDGGSTWSTVQALNSNADSDDGNDRYPDLSTDGSGIWVAVWSSPENLGGTAGTDTDIFFSRSTDNGVSWSAVQTLNSNADDDSGGDFYPRIITDGGGYWIVVWASNENLGGIGTDTDILFSRSTDNGASWSTVQVLNLNADSDEGNDDSPTVMTDGNGNWVALWGSVDTFGDTVGLDSDLFYSRSSDNGVSWSAVQVLNSNAGSDTEGDFGSTLSTDGNGNWVTAWYSREDLGETGGTDYDIFFSRSTNNGLSWSPVETLNSNAEDDTGHDSDLSLITDGNGAWITVWESREDLGGTAGTDQDIFFSRSIDGGATWSAVQTLNSNADADSGGDYHPRVITDGSGNWFTVWSSNEDLEGISGEDYDIFISLSTDNGESWSSVETLNSNADTDTGDDDFTQL
jgi:phosphoribosyl-AMP cyclohydrolase